MDAIKYLKKKKRMLDSLGRKSGRCNGVLCSDCPFDNVKMDCSDFEAEYPEKAIAIVEKWTEEHPQKTILSDFMEKHPKAPIDDDGLPEALCPYDLGYEDDESDCDISCSCRDCWNRPL